VRRISEKVTMNQLAYLIRTAAKLPIFVSCLALFFLMVMTFADVLLRSILNNPIQAATELTRMSLAIVVFAAVPVVSAQGDHISVDLLDPTFKKWGLLRWRDAVVALICGVMLWWPAGRVIDLAERSRSYGDTTEYLNIPVFYISWFIALMTYVTMAALILRGLTLIFAPSFMKEQQ
jgi:TRAP-type C4-dicarboxylate transport system permease small subunit